MNVDEIKTAALAELKECRFHMARLLPAVCLALFFGCAVRAGCSRQTQTCWCQNGDETPIQVPCKVGVDGVVDLRDWTGLYSVAFIQDV